MISTISRFSGESEFYALMRGTSAGYGTASLLKDLGVDVSDNSKIGHEVAEVRIAAFFV